MLQIRNQIQHLLVLFVKRLDLFTQLSLARLNDVVFFFLIQVRVGLRAHPLRVIRHSHLHHWSVYHILILLHRSAINGLLFFDHGLSLFVDNVEFLTLSNLLLLQRVASLNADRSLHVLVALPLRDVVVVSVSEERGLMGRCDLFGFSDFLVVISQTRREHHIFGSGVGLHYLLFNVLTHLARSLISVPFLDYFLRGGIDLLGGFYLGT